MRTISGFDSGPNFVTIDAGDFFAFLVWLGTVTIYKYYVTMVKVSEDH